VFTIARVPSEWTGNVSLKCRSAAIANATEPAMWGTRAGSRKVDADCACPGMMTRMNDSDDADVGRAPICPSCGVTALPADASNVVDSAFVCENPDCDAFGDAVES
jgi:hypothetical protein